MVFSFIGGRNWRTGENLVLILLCKIMQDFRNPSYYQHIGFNEVPRGDIHTLWVYGCHFRQNSYVNRKNKHNYKLCQQRLFKQIFFPRQR